MAVVWGLACLLLVAPAAGGHPVPGTPVGEVVRTVLAGTGPGFIVSARTAQGNVSLPGGGPGDRVFLARAVASVGLAMTEWNGIVVVAPAPEIADLPSLAAWRDAGPAVAVATVSMDLRDTDVREVFRLLARQAGLNLISEKSVRGRVDLRLRGVPWPTALALVAAAEGCGVRRVGSVVVVADPMRLERIAAPFDPAFVWRFDPDDPFQEGMSEEDPGGLRVSVQARDTDIRQVFRMLSHLAHRNFLASADVRGNIDVDLNDVGEDEALHVLARANGFEVGQIGFTTVLAPPEDLRAGRARWLATHAATPVGRPCSLEFAEIPVRRLFRHLGQLDGRPFQVDGLQGRVTLYLVDRETTEVAALLAAVHGWTIRPAGEGFLVSGTDPDDPGGDPEDVHAEWPGLATAAGREAAAGQVPGADPGAAGEARGAGWPETGSPTASSGEAPTGPGPSGHGLAAGGYAPTHVLAVVTGSTGAEALITRHGRLLLVKDKQRVDDDLTVTGIWSDAIQVHSRSLALRLQIAVGGTR